MTGRVVRRLLCWGGVLAAVVGLCVVSAPAPSVPLAPAADVSQFNPGNIISDSVFFDGNGMSVQQIDAFLDVKGMSCRAGSDGTPCLKDFTQDTTDRAADSFCAGYTGAPQESAAVIIAKVSASCRVNPKVLLVIMQKEQSLVTNNGSSLYAMRYQKTMGFACPDTAPCDAAYYGFQNQVYSSARQFQRYAANPTSFGYRAGRTSNVLFNPSSACGSSPVYIQNQATAGLYIYTPYQPNAAALAAGYGSGDSCSAYGNRNFWLYFTDWFGSTQQGGESAFQPLGNLEAVTAVTGNQVRLVGWAVDPDTTSPISVHAYVDGQFAASVAADVSRPDVAATLPAWGDRHGLDTVVGVGPGTHTVCAFAINVGAPAGNPSLGCRTVTTGGLPFGNVESATVVNDRAVVSGWAIDPDTSASVDVHVYVNGVAALAIPATGRRADVGSIYPASGTDHGFTASVPLTAGANQVCVYAINLPAPGVNPSLGCRTLTLQVAPIGNLEAVTGDASSIRVTGWALDPESQDPIAVHVYVDGANVAQRTADLPRADVAASRSDAGPRHGYDFSVPVAPGQHTVCVYAINVGQGADNPLLGCRPADVGVLPVGRVDGATVTAFQARVVGWAIDADTAAPIDVHLYVDGVFNQVVTASAPRPDVAAVFPAAGAGHGFDVTVSLSAGSHTICAFGINVLGRTGNPLLSCTTVQVGGGQSLPFGMLEAATTTSGVTAVTGWSVDPDVPTAALDTHYYLDGRFLGRSAAADSRPDVAAAYPGVGAGHGYTGYFVLPSGPHTVCTYAINQGPGSANPALGCTRITVP